MTEWMDGLGWEGEGDRMVMGRDPDNLLPLGIFVINAIITTLSTTFPRQ